MSEIKHNSKLHEEMVTWRHHIHKHPELSFKEEMTSDYIASVLESNNIEMHRGMAVTGIVATIHGTKKARLLVFVLIWMHFQFKRGMTSAINLFMKGKCMLVAMMAIQQCFWALQFT
jgi:hypothetical protein